jgi:hypothetical protein
MTRQTTATQLEAYLKLQPRLNRLEKEMHQFFQTNPQRSYTDLMLAELLGWRLSCVCGRRNQLAKLELIEKTGHIRNPETGVSNQLWRLKQ